MKLICLEGRTVYKERNKINASFWFPFSVIIVCLNDDARLLRAKVAIGERGSGNSQNLIRVIFSGKVDRSVKQILRLAEYRLIYENIDDNRIPSNGAFVAQNLRRKQSNLCVTNWNNQDRKKLSNLENQHQNIRWQQFQQFLSIYIQKLIKFLRPTFQETKICRSKETRY